MRTISLVFAIAIAIATLFYLHGVLKQQVPDYIILIFMDAVRPDHLSCYGYDKTTTPHIDKLASGGIVFDQAISQAPWTLPSVATVLTSTFPCQHGAGRVQGRNVALSGKKGTLGEILSSKGYRTCAMSTAKIYTNQLGLRRGFQESFIIGKGNPLEKVAANTLTEAAIRWLRKNRGKKCFLLIHHYDTHYPYVASAACIEKFDPDYDGRYRLQFGDVSLRILKKARLGKLAEAVNLSAKDIEHIKALYDCEIARTDAAIGRLIDSLDVWGCLEKSMIMVSADHGEEFLEHGSIEHGQTVYDESIRVPLIIYYPKLIKQPVRISDQVGLIDVAPTILDAAGIEVPTYFEGISLLRFIRAKPVSVPKQRPCGLPVRCLIAESIAHRTERKAIRCPPWKLIFDPFFGAVELYNIKNDPLERENLIKTNRETAHKLTSMLLSSMEQYYPGGWCIAWRDPKERRVRVTLTLSLPATEVVAHNFFPHAGDSPDSLEMSRDKRRIFFMTKGDVDWRGVEVRMASRAKVTIEIGGVNQIAASIGETTSSLPTPLIVSPEEAKVERSHLQALFAQSSAQWIIFWLEPGSQPGATAARQDELRRKLKAIGYID